MTQEKAHTANGPTASTSDTDFVTFGCRLNIYETEVMRSHAKTAGIEDAVVINTCAVTTEAVRQARQAIRRARKEKPDAPILVTGCAAQIDPQAFADMPEVTHVMGNSEKLDGSAWSALAETNSTPRVAVADIMTVKETAPHMVSSFDDRSRAFVQVQNGCDHRCTFCIIPYGRGNSRSVPAGSVIDQIRALVEAGHREVVLTGVDITSYGADLPGTPGLGSLVRRILKLVPDLERLRLSSLDSVETDDTLIDLIAAEERIMPHLHLSLQAGDNMILKRMKRRHTREDAIRFCERMRRHRPDMTFGADLIAGFPTETEEMFANSLALVDECDLTFLHVFPYSPRPGTPAARMPQVDKPIIKERAARLRAAGALALKRHLDGWVGKDAEALVERPGFARLPQFTPIALTDRTVPAGSMIRVRLLHHNDKQLTGETISNLASSEAETA